ncbi:helix-turn-helix domain-containing protein [Rhodococcus xishaensis]|uniref:XRE family transcriptional regulator n=1 Tax=Rhodococcus xishaensis TaxID=2487364 RepID=A0A438B3V8_9NOCA|nr:helix-turn-helix transcriptional regulator [Rhodococcus xishaensis]RVW05675.1 XRE family transcriptional regulator [Rhodococcus xishaensis]
MTHRQPGTTSPFGALLRRWRGNRGLSQLALAAAVGSTSRHMSFLETGRSRPSEQMVLRLGEALGIPLREQNRLLEAAGLPTAYPEVALEDADLAPFRAAIDQLLTAHMPYPAVVVDEHWNVLLANRASATFFGDALVGSNLAHRYFADPAAAEAIVNWPQVAWAGMDRLRHQLALRPFDDKLRELAMLAEQATVGLPRPSPPTEGLVVCPWFRVDGQVIRMIGMAARFDITVAVTLEELRVELLYPLDSDAERFFREAGTTKPANH